MEEDESVITAISDGLTEYNRSTRPDPDAAPLILSIENDGEVIAGALGRSAYSWMRVDVLWVKESLRGEGYGEALMQRIEDISRARGCRAIHLDTHDFQAPGFYLKLGYQVFAELPDYPEGEKHYYMKKSLEQE